MNIKNPPGLLLATPPRVMPKLDPEFRPCSLGDRAFRKAVSMAQHREHVVIAIERENHFVKRFEIDVFPESHPFAADSLILVERSIKFLLWAIGGWKIVFAGPDYIGRAIAEAYSKDGARAFDADLMGRVYEKEFTVSLVRPSSVPAESGSSAKCGGHLTGCRIGFDLGASDYKVVAIQDGETVFSEEIPWTPAVEADPAYHYEAIKKGLTLAASHLPRVDAIGGSSAGVIVNSRVMVASLFRSVPKEKFDSEVKDIFLRIGKELNTPILVMNDGDVTALAGGMSIGTKAILGVAMGSSQAGGYLDASGNITGWLNELAFAPVDYSSKAAADEWSKDIGVGVMYFSQQAVNKLAKPAGIEFPDAMPLPERLVQVQELMTKQDGRAYDIYQTIGAYLGYAVAHYATFYQLNSVMVLGRVTTGAGGDVIVATAKDVLLADFPELASKIELSLPDEKSRRVGQAVAAASLVAI